VNDLWGTHAAGWAEHERQYRPSYEAALELLGAPRCVLDVGCGAGTFLRAAADRGAEVSGLDASPALLELARAQLPHADLVLGDLQAIPYGDATFDAVTSFTSYWFAADPVEALREAGRVAKPGAPVLVTVHGQATDLTALMDAIAALLGREPRRGTLPLENHLRAAGLEPQHAGEIPITLTFADDEALVRQLRAPAAMVAAARAVGDDRVAAAIREAAPGLRLRHEWRYAIATNASPSPS
jgi:SAM-dependent methyltransferase